jgi:IS30 family transposase
MDNTGKRRELTEKERYVIEKCLKRGDSRALIAIIPGVSVRTINQEVNRGTSWTVSFVYMQHSS